MSSSLRRRRRRRPSSTPDRVIVFVSSVTAFESLVRIRPCTVAPVPRTLAPSVIVVPLNALPAPSVTPVASLESCRKMLQARGALPPLTMFTEPAAAAAVVSVVCSTSISADKALHYVER